MIARAERHLPAETFVAESGAKSVKDARHLRGAGADVVLMATRHPALIAKLYALP